MRMKIGMNSTYVDDPLSCSTNELKKCRLKYERREKSISHKFPHKLTVINIRPKPDYVPSDHLLSITKNLRI